MEILIINNNVTTFNWKYKNLGQRHMDNLEEISKRIINDNKLKKIAIFTLGNLMYCSKVLAAENPLGKINNTGTTVLEIARTIGYWICLLGCIADIIKNLMQGDTKGITKIITKFSLAFGALYALPWLFDLIKASFK